MRMEMGCFLEKGNQTEHAPPVTSLVAPESAGDRRRVKLAGQAHPAEWLSGVPVRVHLFPFSARSIIDTMQSKEVTLNAATTLY